MTATESAPRPQAPKQLTRPEMRVKIARAQLRLITDKRLGRETPEWVKVLAARKV